MHFEAVVMMTYGDNKDVLQFNSCECEDTYGVWCDVRLLRLLTIVNITISDA